jgi:ArsR family transcriptional regulator, arsenate/arsenite/antimonite-responsive transcriptional repressor
METSQVLRSLAALAQEHRLAIFRLLVEAGPAGIAAGRIAERVGLPAATTSFHLKELVNAGLAVANPQSRFIYYRAEYTTMNGLVRYLTENCCAGSACDAPCAPRRPPKPTARRRSA